MTRRDGAYWQRLRKDRRSNLAAILAAVAALAGTVSLVAAVLPGSPYQARANPLYLPLMLPMVWWVVGLTGFTPRAVRLWKPALVAAGLAATASLAVHLHRGEEWTLPAVTLGTTLAASAGSLLLLRGSLVAREGPAR